MGEQELLVRALFVFRVAWNGLWVLVMARGGLGVPGGVVKWCWCGFVRVWKHCCGLGLPGVVCGCLWVLAMAMWGRCGVLGLPGSSLARQPDHTI